MGATCTLFFNKIHSMYIVSEEHGGSWNSIHVLQVTPDASGKPMAHYQLTSTILLEVVTGSKKLGTLNLSGSLTRQVNTAKEN
jgi:capping protein beta